MEEVRRLEEKEEIKLDSTLGVIKFSGPDRKPPSTSLVVLVPVKSRFAESE